MDIIFDLEDGTASFVGTMSGARTFRVPPRRYLGVRFAPGGCGALRAAADELVDAHESLEDAIPAAGEVTGLAERMADAPGAAETILWPVLGAWLASRGADPAVAAADRHVRRSRGRVSVEELAGALGLSERTLERRYRRHVGLTPKHCLRIERLNAARGLVERACGPSLSAIAYGSGYADQAHFTREFRSLLGRSPGEWRSGLRTPVGFVQDGDAAEV
jgi:AraC-like DNA-binding protein